MNVKLKILSHNLGNGILSIPKILLMFPIISDCNFIILGSKRTQLVESIKNLDENFKVPLGEECL